jgi:hypothetical protein
LLLLLLPPARRRSASDLSLTFSSAAFIINDGSKAPFKRDVSFDCARLCMLLLLLVGLLSASLPR